MPCWTRSTGRTRRKRSVERASSAICQASTHPELLTALAFFLNWLSLGHATRLLIDRQDEVDGDHYDFLAPAAETLVEKYPLAATVALGVMIDFTLNEGRQKRYGYAAQHLATCADLAGRIEDFGPVEPHPAYAARLKAKHGKKTGFWSKVEAA